MGAGGEVQRQGHPDGQEEGELYAIPILLPLIVGLAAAAAGVLLLRVDVARITSLVVLLDAGVLLVVAGAVLYFLIGFWLIPGSLVLGGGTVLIAFEVASHAPSWTTGAGVLWLVAGALGTLKALVEVRRRYPMVDR